jgi:hypothetical protein
MCTSASLIQAMQPYSKIGSVSVLYMPTMKSGFGLEQRPEMDWSRLTDLDDFSTRRWNSGSQVNLASNKTPRNIASLETPRFLPNRLNDMVDLLSVGKRLNKTTFDFEGLKVICQWLHHASIKIGLLVE